MKRVQVLMESDCHKVLKCVCAQMGMTLSEWFLEASHAQLLKAVNEHEHLKMMVTSIPLKEGSCAYNMREQMTLNDQKAD